MRKENIITRRGDSRRGLNWWLDLLSTYTQLGATSNSNSLHWVTCSRDHCNCSTHKDFYVFTSRFLVTDLNNGDSSASVLMSLLAAYYSQLTHWESESQLLYDLRFTANKFILAPSPLRSTTRNFFQLNPYDHSPYELSSLTRGCVTCTNSTCSVDLRCYGKCLFFLESVQSAKSDGLE
jgi:hypothetical protein